MKYLGIIIDHKLTWKHHISELRTKLGRGIGILSKLKRHKMPNKSLNGLYYSVFQCHLSYGITSWGFTTKENRDKLQNLQNKCVRVIGNLKRDENTDLTRKILGILSVDQLWQLEIAKNMWDFENLNLPCALADLFQYIQHDSAAQTRSCTNNLVSVSRPMITETHGRNCLTFIGAKILNELKLLELFKTPSKEKFVKEYTKLLLAS